MIFDIRKLVSTLVFIIAVSTLCLGQDTTTGGPDSIIAGPFGVPRMVMSEGGGWVYPIKVASTAGWEDFIPDITSPGWMQWHVEDFRQKGMYFTYVYLYNRRNHATTRVLIYVYTRANTVTIQPPLIAPISVSVAKAPWVLSAAIPKITTLVRQEMAHFKDPSIQDVINADKFATWRMIEHQGQPPEDPSNAVKDLAEDKARFLAMERGQPPAADSPEYDRTSPQLIPGARPGINCGIGFQNYSCYGANNSTLPNEGSGQPPPFFVAANSPEYDPAKDGGLHRVIDGVTAPQLIYAPDPQFSEEARKTIEQATDQVREAKAQTQLAAYGVRTIEERLPEYPADQVANFRALLAMDEAQLARATAKVKSAQSVLHKYQGICVVSLIVDTQGNPQKVTVARPLERSLDEKALEAVRQYKFKPATEAGKPVPVEMNVEVNFGSLR